MIRLMRFPFILISLALLLAAVSVQAQDSRQALPATAAATVMPTHAATPPATATTIPTATATGTATPTLIPATATMTATPDLRDSYEPNDTPQQAAPINLNEAVPDLTLDPVGDVDYFHLYLKPAQIVRVATYPDGAADTRLTVYSPAGDVLGENDDRSATDLGSTVAWQTQTEGWYLLRVVSATPFGGGYRLQAALDAPTPTATAAATPQPGPTATPIPTGTPAPTATPYTDPDPGEPNNQPQEATAILPGHSYDFTLGPIGVDTHDFFTLLGKAGVSYRCTAAEPDGVDPALRVYAGPIGQGELVASNDDLSAADIGSAVTFTAAHNEPLFIVAEAQAGYGGYTLTCQGGAAAAANANGSGGAATPTATPTPDPTMLRVDIFVDGNGDGHRNDGEGIDGTRVQIIALDGTAAFTTTSRQGLVRLPVAELDGATQLLVSVPYLHHSEPVDLTTTTHVAIALPAPTLPVLLP